MVDTVNFALIPESEQDHWFNEFGNKALQPSEQSAYKLHLNVAGSSYFSNLEKMILILDDLGRRTIQSFKIVKINPKQDEGYQHYLQVKKLISDILLELNSEKRISIINNLISSQYDFHKGNQLPTQFLDQVDDLIKQGLPANETEAELNNILKVLDKRIKHVERLVENSQITIYLPKNIKLNELKKFCLQVEEAFLDENIKPSPTCADSDVKVGEFFFYDYKVPVENISQLWMKKKPSY